MTPARRSSSHRGRQARPRSALKNGGAVGAIALSAALSACGGDESDEPVARESSTGQRTNLTGSAPAGTTEGRPSGDAGAASGRPEDQSAGDGRARAGCVFDAPPGRLAEAEVAIHLDGVSCGEAIPLARASALGQPAGANLVIEVRGFRCEPSTRAKGANVTYTCTEDTGSASFDVVWSERGG